MSRRQDQLASTLRRAIQEVISRGFHDPRIKGLITVTEVSLTPDLKTATVDISVMPEEHEELTLHGLRAAGKHIRHEVSDSVLLRSMPKLDIRLDRRFKKQAAVLDALARANLQRNDQPDPDTGGTPAEEPEA